MSLFYANLDLRGEILIAIIIKYHYEYTRRHKYM